jgi:hypothetical protein
MDDETLRKLSKQAGSFGYSAKKGNISEEIIVQSPGSKRFFQKKLKLTNLKLDFLVRSQVLYNRSWEYFYGKFKKVGFQHRSLCFRIAFFQNALVG